MSVSLAGKLKELRKSKNVSQEKFAEYLGVSYQAVSKLRNPAGNAAALTVTPLAGGTRPVSAHLVIMQIG